MTLDENTLFDPTFDAKTLLDKKRKIRKTKRRNGASNFILKKICGSLIAWFKSRSLIEWLKVLICYVFFLAFLAGIFAFSWFMFNKFFIKTEPIWQNTNGIIGNSPKLNIYPKLKLEEKDPVAIKIFKDKSIEGENYLLDGRKKEIEKFLEPYRNAEINELGKNCDGPNEKADEDHGCYFPLEMLGTCGKVDYEYDDGTKCGFLKLNRIYGAKNEAYNDTETLPENMPEILKNFIAAQDDKNQVWVDCDGKTFDDKELIDKVELYPGGFPNKYFPYLMQADYLSPLVAVKVKPKMPLANDRIVNITCRAWAKNIGYDLKEKEGFVDIKLHFFDENLPMNQSVLL